MLVALSLGEQAAIWLAVIDLAAGWAVAGLWRRSARSCLWLPAPRAGLWAGVGVALAYALFSGWGVPAQRTVWMLLTLALLRQLGLRWPWPLSLLLAACIVTAIDPWAISQAGFWLSFVAVGLLMASGPDMLPPGWRAQLGAALHSQWVATLGLAPLPLLFFQQISVVGLLANLVAIPVVSLLITPLALAGSLVPLLWDLAVLCLQGPMLWLRRPACPGRSGICRGRRYRPQVCGLLAAALLGCLCPGARGCWTCRWRWACCGRLCRARRRANWSCCATATRTMSAAPPALLAGLPAHAPMSSLDGGHGLRAARPPQRRCERGLRWSWDGVDFEVLHPQPADYCRETVKPNALSCVLKVRAGARSLLLTGDIEAAQEQTLLGLQ